MTKKLFILIFLTNLFSSFKADQMHDAVQMANELKAAQSPKEDGNKFDAIKESARNCDMQNFWKNYDSLANISTIEHVELMHYIAKNACDGKECKVRQDMLDCLTTIEALKVLGRNPELKNALEELFKTAALADAMIEMYNRK